MEKTLDTPIFRVSRTICTDKFDALYAKLKPKGVSVSALLAKAVAMTLEKHPVVNAAYDPSGAIKYNDDINVAMAVALDGGLITPTIRKCNEMDIYTVGREWRDLVNKAKSGSLKPEEYNTGTFAITNLGMFGGELGLTVSIATYTRPPIPEMPVHPSLVPFTPRPCRLHEPAASPPHHPTTRYPRFGFSLVVRGYPAVGHGQHPCHRRHQASGRGAEERPLWRREADDRHDHLRPPPHLRRGRGLVPQGPRPAPRGGHRLPCLLSSCVRCATHGRGRPPCSHGGCSGMWAGLNMGPSRGASCTCML